MSAVLSTDRYKIEVGFHLRVQVPAAHAVQVLEAITEAADLAYGDYTHVSFEQMDGLQRFKSTGSGRNKKTADVVQVRCREISVFLSDDAMIVERVLRALYRVHPYEEPVIILTPAQRSLHIAGMDEDNPNRFWNQPVQDWVPSDHRG